MPYHSGLTVPDREVVLDGDGWHDTVNVNAEEREIESGGAIFVDAISSR